MLKCLRAVSSVMASGCSWVYKEPRKSLVLRFLCECWKHLVALSFGRSGMLFASSQARGDSRSDTCTPSRRGWVVRIPFFCFLFCFRIPAADADEPYRAVPPP